MPRNAEEARHSACGGLVTAYSEGGLVDPADVFACYECENNDNDEREPEAAEK